MMKLCSHSAKERELNNDVKVKVQTMRPSENPIHHEKRCNRHQKTIRSPWTSISRSWEIDPSVAKIFEAFRYQLKHVAPSMVKSRVEVISSGDKPFRGDQENHVLVRCTSSNQNWGDKNFRCKIGNFMDMMKYATLWAETRPLCVSCVSCLSIRGWCSAQQFGVVTKQPLFRWVPTLYRASQGWKWISQKVMPVPWRIEKSLRKTFAVVAPPPPTNVLRFVRCWCKFASSAKGERKVSSTGIDVERLNYIEVDIHYTYAEIIQTISRYFCDSEQGMLFALWQWALWTQGYGVIGGDLQLDGLQAQSWEIFLYLKTWHSPNLRVCVKSKWIMKPFLTFYEILCWVGELQVLPRILAIQWSFVHLCSSCLWCGLWQHRNCSDAWRVENDNMGSLVCGSGLRFQDFAQLNSAERDIALEFC